MNTNFFRVLIFILVLLCSNSKQSAAQLSGCKIKYDYDVKGNRIKREYQCVNPPNPWDPAPWDNNSTLLSNLYPNPTSGMVTGTFTVPVTSATVSVFTMGGVMVLQQVFSQQVSAFTVNITNQLQGNYLFTIATPEQVESYVVTKLDGGVSTVD